MNFDEAQAINNLSPGNQVYTIGDKLRTALDHRLVRRDEYVLYVDGSVEGSGDGSCWDKAFKYISEGITALNTLSGKGATLLIAPGLYVDKSGNTLTASDCLIQGVGSPEGTYWWGGTDAKAVGAATADLLTITGGNNVIAGLSFYNNLNTTACIKLVDTGGGVAGSYNVITNCLFSPSTQDGFAYGIEFAGGVQNIIQGNLFYGAKTAAILMADGADDLQRNIIKDNHFVGTNIGVSITGVNHNTLIDSCWFSSGSDTSENMTNGIVISVGMTAGALTVMNSAFEMSAANDIDDNKAGGSLYEINNTNGS